MVERTLKMRQTRTTMNLEREEDKLLMFDAKMCGNLWEIPWDGNNHGIVVWSISHVEREESREQRK